MIEKMTKYSFILLSSYTEEFLQKLQQIGMMDITRSHKPVDEASAALLDRMKDCKDTAAYLKKADWSKDPDKEFHQLSQIPYPGVCTVGRIRPDFT